MKMKMGLAALFFALFIGLILAVSLVDVAAIGPAGTSVGLSSLNGKVHEALGTHSKLYTLTKLLGYFTILVAVGFAALGIVQAFRRGSLKKIDGALWSLALLYVLVAALYVLFEKVIVNYRPVLMEGETHPEASFPSSHTMLFVVILGSAAMIAGRYIKNRRVCRLVQAACVALCLAGVIGRLVSGVHWLTDILGGVLISLSLLMLFSGVLERQE